MAIVFNKQLIEGFNYVVESERGDKKPFTVTLKTIDSVRLVTLEDGIFKRSADESVSLATGSYNVSLCLNSVTGWDNLNDVDGKAIPIELDPKGYISSESLAIIPTTLITEIAGVIAATSQDPSTIQLFTAE